MKCPKCSTELPKGASQCPNCGQKFVTGKYCPHCRAVIPSTATVCPQCKQAVGGSPAPSPFDAGPKRQSSFRWWQIPIYILIFILGVGVGVVGSKPEASNPQISSSSAQPVANSPTATPSSTPSPTPIPTQPPEEALHTQQERNIEDAAALIELAIQEGFGSDYTITTDEDTITVSVWKEGVAAAVTFVQAAGGDTNHPDWVTVKESFTSLYNSLNELLIAGGYNDYSIFLNALNDQNKENTLLTIAYGIIIYDALA